MEQEIITTKGDDTGEITSLVKYLEDARGKGATHYKMEWANDPHWSFKWFVCYRVKSDEEIREEQIKDLEQKLDTLKKEQENARKNTN